MDTKESLSVETVLQAVATWAPAQRFDLIHQILKTLEPPSPAIARQATLQQAVGLASANRAADSVQPREPSLHRVAGLLATDQPPPTDEEVAQWLDERRMEKYG